MTRKVPAPAGVKFPDTADVPATFSGFVDENTGAPAHVGSAGPNTSNVTVPVGAAAPAGAGPNVAVSWNEAPSAIGVGDTAVTIGSGALFTTTASAGSAQADAELA